MPVWAQRALDTLYHDQEPPVADSIDSRLQRLKTILNSEPPNNDAFVHLLQDLCDRENNHTTSNPLARCMLQWLADPQGGGLVPNKISWIDVFRQSVIELDRDPNWVTKIPKFECASSTKVIWDYAADLLYDQGAIHVCADYGNDALLHLTLEKLEDKEKDDARRMNILFRCHYGALGSLTALGVAIRRRRDLCVDTILTRVPKEYLEEHFGKKSKILQDEEFGNFPLHQVSTWTDQFLVKTAISEEDLVKGLQLTEKILQKITDKVPSCLAILDDQGRPPYYMARKLTESCRKKFPGSSKPFDGMEKLLRDQIFKYLGKNTEQVMRALYCKDGKSKIDLLKLKNFMNTH